MLEIKILYKTYNYLAFLRAIAECFARHSHRLGVRPSVRPSHPGTVSKRYKLKSQNFHHGLPQNLVTKFREPWVRGFPSN